MRTLLSSLLALCLLALARPAAAQDHPFSGCAVERNSVPTSSTVTLFCAGAQVSLRRFRGAGSATARLGTLKQELQYVADALGTELQWNEGEMAVDGVKRPAVQYTLNTPEGVGRAGLAAPATEGTDLIDCSSGTREGAKVCPDLVAAMATEGLPPGAGFLNFPDQVRTATILGRTVKVPLGCKAQWLFQDAIHVACADGELIFGSNDTIRGGGIAADPIDAIQEQLGGTSAGTEGPCTVGGTRTTCWSSTVLSGAPTRAITAHVTLSDVPAVFGCLYTAVGEAPHELCAPLLK